MISSFCWMLNKASLSQILLYHTVWNKKFFTKLIFVVYYCQWVIKLYCKRSNFKEIFAVMFFKQVCMCTWKTPWNWLFSNLATSKTLRYWFYWKLSKFWKSCPPFWINHFVKWNFNLKFVISDPKNSCMQNVRFVEEKLLLLASFSRFPTTVMARRYNGRPDTFRTDRMCSVEIDTISTISRTFTFGSFKAIPWILLIISGVVILFGRPGPGMVSVLVQPQRNSVNHFWTIPYDRAESE